MPKETKENEYSEERSYFVNKNVLFYIRVLVNCSLSRALQKELAKDFFENRIPQAFENLEKILKSRGGKYFADNKVKYLFNKIERAPK